MSGATVGAALLDGRKRGLDRLDAQLLVGHVVGRDRTWVIAHPEEALDAAQQARWQALVQRRASGVPLAQLVGGKEFRGLWLRVDEHVLVPRPETELLVERALECLAPGVSGPRVLDLGTGSGAVALAVKAARPDVAAFASDLDPAALAIARANAAALGLAVSFAQGSWWVPWAGARFQVVLANPPYVAAGDPHLAALGHEPTLALMGGARGDEALAAIVAGAAAHLHAGGWLWLEHGHDQGNAVRSMLAQAGFAAIGTHRDLAGVERVSGGRVV